MKIKLSKSQWELIGKKAGWVKLARNQFMYVSFFDDLLFEDNQDVQHNIKNNNVSPENVWEISYDIDVLDDNDLVQEIQGRSRNQSEFYRELFNACSIRAINYSNGIEKKSDGLISLIEETSDIASFWDFLKQNRDIYRQERSIENRDIDMTDDQQEASDRDLLRPSV